MKTLAFAVLVLSLSSSGAAQQVTLLENEAGGASKTAAAADDGMPQVIVPKQEELPAAVPVAVTTAAAVNKPVKAVINKKKKSPVPVKSAPPPVTGAGFSVGKTHTVTGGDTLWDLSNKYYKDPYKWGKIYNANLGTVANPDRIYPREELVIPDLTEEVKPEAGKAPLITGGETVKEAQFTGSDVRQAEASSPAVGQQAAAAAAPAAKETPKAAQTELGDMLKDFDANDLSEEMPEDQKEWSAGVNIVPDSWQEDGVVDAAEKGEAEQMANSLSISGDIILVSMSGQAAVKKGDYLSVYMKGANAYDKGGRKLGREIQRAGTVQVLSAEGRQARARVLEAFTAIIKGYVVKKK